MSEWTLPWLTLGLVTLLMVLQVLDVISTNRVLRLGGREFNPLVLWVMRRMGRAWWLPKLMVAALISSLALALADPQLDAVLAGIGGVYALVVGHNFFTAWLLGRVAAPVRVREFGS